MPNVPGLGNREPDARTAPETPQKRAHAGILQALTEAFGRPVNAADISVNQIRGKFRVTVVPTVIPPKNRMTIFGFPLPFQRRQSGAIDAALANVNVGAKRRIFFRMFPEKLGRLHASKTFRDEESLMRFVLDCQQRVGNGAQDGQAKAKTEQEQKTKGEVAAKITAEPGSPLTPPVSRGLPGMTPGGLPGMPGGMPGMPGIGPGAAPGGSPPSFTGLGGRPPSSNDTNPLA